jgi:ADP-ribosylglycohydrolase
MACSVLAVLTRHQGRIDMDELADSFVRHHDLYRGYGAGANTMLRDIREGVPWPKAASALFGGTGSYGNGAAMRAAPIGAWFAGDPDSAARQAARSAVVTHTHPEGITGAVAVAVAASLTADPAQHALGAREFLDQVLERLPNGRVRHGVWAARGMAGVASVPLVVRELGNGRQVCAQDTVPFALWVVARHRHDFAEAVWTAVEAGGDVDTTCAIIGGILAADPEVAAPADWTEAAEALPDWAPRDDEQPSGPNRCGTP